MTPALAITTLDDVAAANGSFSIIAIGRHSTPRDVSTAVGREGTDDGLCVAVRICDRRVDTASTTGYPNSACARMASARSRSSARYAGTATTGSPRSATNHPAVDVPVHSATRNHVKRRPDRCVSAEHRYTALPESTSITKEDRSHP